MVKLIIGDQNINKKMKTIIFNKYITPENVQILCNEIENNFMHEIYLYFSSEGGTKEGEEMLVNYLDRLAGIKYNVSIEIIAYDKLYCRAFNVFFRCNLTKTILKTTTGMIQNIDNDIKYLEWLSKIAFKKNIWSKIKNIVEVSFDAKQLTEILLNYGTKLKDINGDN
jgi:hypothetical protein